MSLPMTTTHHASPTGRTTRNHPFAPDVLLPEQFHGPESAAAKSSGERSLMLAVLEDGIRCFQEFSRDHRVGPQMLGRQAQRWIESTSADWPFAFNNVCEFLDLDPDHLRQAVLRSRAEDGDATPRRRTRHRVYRLNPRAKDTVATAKPGRS